MRDFIDQPDRDIAQMVAAIGAPPVAPLAMPRQILTAPDSQPWAAIWPRLFGILRQRMEH